MLNPFKNLFYFFRVWQLAVFCNKRKADQVTSAVRSL